MKKEPTELENLIRMSSEISKQTNLINQMLQAMNQLSLSFQDEKKFKEMISHVAKMGKEENKQGNVDHLYQLINSPAMKEIVREVLQHRKRGR